MFSLYMKFEKNQKQLEKNRRFKSFFHEIGQNLPFFEKKSIIRLQLRAVLRIIMSVHLMFSWTGGVPDESEVPLCRLPPEIQF